MPVKRDFQINDFFFFCLSSENKAHIDQRGMTHIFLDWKKKSKSNAKLKNKVL